MRERSPSSTPPDAARSVPRGIVREALRPVAPGLDEWTRKVVSTALVTTDGSRLDYQGEALVSTPDAGHFVEFELKSSPLRRSRLHVPLSVSRDATVSLSINGERVSTAALKASADKAPLLHHLTDEVTGWAEGEETVRLRLNFFYQGKSGRTTILLDGTRPEWSPHLVQEWAWRYALPAVAFFVMAWLAVAEVATLILAHFRFFGDTARDFAVLVNVVVWIVPLLGLPVLSNIPLRPMMRKLYGRTRRRRAPALAALAALFVSAGAGVGVVSYCWWKRHQYVTLIDQALKSSENDRMEYARRAFVLIPWRKEAQILVERQVYRLRNSEDMRVYKERVARFVSDEEVMSAVRTAPGRDGLPVYITDDDRTLSDPVFWYASILPEKDAADNPATLNRAIALLSSRDDPLSLIQRKSLEFHLRALQSRAAVDGGDPAAAGGLQETYRGAARELGELLETYSEDLNVSASFPYQIACDALGTYYINLCRAGGGAPLYKDSWKWFRKVLQARSQQSSLSKTQVWHRPPEKLDLYYMLCPECRETSEEGKARAAIFVANFRYCYCQANNIAWRDCPADAFAKTLDSYSNFMKRDAWRGGTVLTSEVPSEVKNGLLSEGWRY